MIEKIFNDKDIISSILFDCQCAVFLLDITNKDSLVKLKKLVENNSFEESPYLKIILVENKTDENREVSEDEIDIFMEENNIKDNMKISIKNNSGIKELSDKIKEYINNDKDDIPINFSSQIINEFEDNLKEKEEIKGIEEINLIFSGNSNSGKSSLFFRIDKNHFKESFMSSIGIDRIHKLFKYKKELYRVNLTDIAGQDRFRNNIPKSYYINSHGIFLVFDLCEQESFNDISIWMNEINQNFNSNDGNKKGPVIFLIGNRLEKLNRVITREQAEDKASFYGIKYFEISSKLNINIQEVFSRIISECIKNIGKRVEQNTFKIKDKENKKKQLLKFLNY